MITYLNPALALLTIAFGLFGFLAPRYTASALQLRTDGGTMGLSEMRASVGGLFVAMGLFALLSAAPMAYAMIGIAYAGAATGRLLSIFVDKPPRRKAMVFFAFEAVPAAYLILANL